MAFGLTPQGFSIPTLEEIRQSINDELVNFFGPSIDLENGLLARFVGILAERYSQLWEALEAVYNSQNPDTASGAALAELCLLTGTLKLEAIFSTVTLTLTGTPSTIVPAGQQVSTKSTNQKFLTAESGTIGAVSAWAGSTLYAEGARVVNALRVYQAIDGGTSAGSGGPTTTKALTEVDGTVTWLCLGDGTGAVDVAGQSLNKGPIIGVSGDITEIDQPYGGWNGVINVLDATVGYDDQTDESLRLSREEELSQPGASTADAIRAALLFLAGVVSVTVFHNDTDVVDVDGLGPHTVEALVSGGDDASIGATLLAQIAAGINTDGNTTTNPVDSQGVTHTIKFSRPDLINIGVAITLTKDPAEYPADGDAQVKAAIVKFGNAQKAGKNAVASAIAAQAFKVAGVLDVTVCNISSTPAPGTPAAPSTNTTIAIALRELATYDTSFITVTSSDGTP